MIFADAQGGVWTVGRTRWLGSRQWIPIKNPREFIPSAGLTGDIFELALLVVLAILVLVPIILGTLEYLLKLLIRPLRLLLQPSARDVGWGFDVVQVVPAGAPVTVKPTPVRMHIRVPNRAGARQLRQQFVTCLPTGGGLHQPQIQQGLRVANATVQAESASGSA
jgi:hypothetical protein